MSRSALEHLDKANSLVGVADQLLTKSLCDVSPRDLDRAQALASLAHAHAAIAQAVLFDEQQFLEQNRRH